MTVELIPVIEIGYNNPEVIVPDKYPYWDNSEIWDKYHEECNIIAGFKDKLTPYLKGSSFYKISDISDDNLKQITIDHTQKLREGKYGREHACSFFGGYVLKVDGLDKYFPQCCGELSDISYWERLSKGQQSYNEGHPAPQVSIDKDLITFDFSVEEFDETFNPPPMDSKLHIDRLALMKAVEKAKIELDKLALRLDKLNQDENLNLANITGLLIWDNANYSE